MAQQKKATDGYAAPAVIRAFDILKLLAHSDAPMNLTDLAQTLDCGKSTMHGLLKALIHIGAITRSGKAYEMGPALAELTLRDWNVFKLVEKVKPTLSRLRDRTRETVFLGIPGIRKSTIIATQESLKPLKISAPAGTEIPLQAGAVGKVFLSRMSDSDALNFIETHGLPRFTANAITNVSAYLEELRQVRKQGFALDNEEYLSGVKAVAVDIRNTRRLSMALWIAGFASTSGNPDDDPTTHDNITAVQEAAAELKSIIDVTP